MDIVERLRFRNKAAEFGDNLCVEAADEIWRLRALAISLAEDYAAAVGAGGPASRVNQALALKD